jgi:hypothetical protein
VADAQTRTLLTVTAATASAAVTWRRRASRRRCSPEAEQDAMKTQTPSGSVPAQAPADPG